MYSVERPVRCSGDLLAARIASEYTFINLGLRLAVFSFWSNSKRCGKVIVIINIFLKEINKSLKNKITKLKMDKNKHSKTQVRLIRIHSEAMRAANRSPEHRTGRSSEYVYGRAAGLIEGSHRPRWRSTSKEFRAGITSPPPKTNPQNRNPNKEEVMLAVRFL